jgi:predicted protein tyrosine phosphatase
MAERLSYRVTVCGLDELTEHGAAGVSHVLSILDPGAPVPPAFEGFGGDRRLELRFHDVIDDLPGFVAPGFEDVGRMLGFAQRLPGATKGCHLLIHCHAGISRSSAAFLLVLAQARPTLPADGIAAAVLRARPRAWPNLRIVELGDRMLGRHGEVVAAAQMIYRRRLADEPEFGASLAAGGRGREVEAGRGRDREGGPQELAKLRPQNFR